MDKSCLGLVVMDSRSLTVSGEQSHVLETRHRAVNVSFQARMDQFTIVRIIIRRSLNGYPMVSDSEAPQLASGPWVHHVRERDLPEIRRSALEADAWVVELDALEMRSLDELFYEFSRAFVFPDYFGWNWAAFDECMTELTNAPARAYVTIVAHADVLLAGEPLERVTLLRQLERIGRYWGGSLGLGVEWGGGEVPFHTVLADSEER